MQVKIIPNLIQRHRPLVHGPAPLVHVRRLALYDTLPARRFEFVPL